MYVCVCVCVCVFTYTGSGGPFDYICIHILIRSYVLINSIVQRYHIYIYMYVCVFTNLLSISIHSYQEKQKKKPPEFRDNNIPNHCLGEKEKKSSFGEKK